MFNIARYIILLTYMAYIVDLFCYCIYIYIYIYCLKFDLFQNEDQSLGILSSPDMMIYN